MGSPGWSLHLANVGIPVRLLDIAPQELLPEEAKAGLRVGGS